MRRLVASMLAMVVIAGVSAVAQKGEADVDQLLQAYQAAWNKGDAKALAALYSQNAIRIGADGEPVLGRSSIEQSFVTAFGGPWKGTTLTLKTGRTQKVTTDVHVVEGTYEVSGGSGGPQRGRFLNTVVRESSQWRIAALAAIPPPPAK
jgi:uncharacterized protein (TIGR02246 family)